MPSPNPRLGSRDLALVVAIFDHASLRRTADALGQSVASISKQLLLLEDRLRQPLFTRSPTGVVPTRAGVALAYAGRRILADIAATEASLRPEPPPEVTVVIGAGPFPAPTIARAVAPAVQARWPHIRLEVQVGYPEDLVAGVKDGRLHLAVCHTDDIVLPPGLGAEVVQRLVPLCLVRQGHPLLEHAAHGPVPGTMLAAYDMAGSRLSSRMVSWLEALMGKAPRTGFVSSDLELVAEVLGRSDMFAIMSAGVGEAMCRQWPLTPLNVALTPYVHEVSIVSMATRSMTPAAHDVQCILRDMLARDETIHAAPSEASTAG